MKKNLYIGEGVTLSHILRPLELAEKCYDEYAISKENVEIHFACDERYKLFITNKNFIFHKITTMSSESFLKSLKSGEKVFDYEYLSNCLREDEELVNSIMPDIIYSDYRFSMYNLCA